MEKLTHVYRSCGTIRFRCGFRVEKNSFMRPYCLEKDCLSCILFNQWDSQREECSWNFNLG